MKKSITIILALIMTLLSTPQKATDEPPVTAVKTPQSAITVQAEQVPEDNETTTETAFVSEEEEPKIKMEIKETTSTENKQELTETKRGTEEKTPKVQEITSNSKETLTEEIAKNTEKVIAAEPKEETVECIDEGDQCLAEYKPQVGGQPNPFENDTPTKIDDRPVEDYVGEGEDRPGEGKHF